MRSLVLYSDQILPEAEKVDRELVALMDKPNPTIGYVSSSPDPHLSSHFGGGTLRV